MFSFCVGSLFDFKLKGELEVLAVASLLMRMLLQASGVACR